MGRGAISDQAQAKRRSPIVVFSLFLIAGLAFTLFFSVPLLKSLIEGERPHKDAFGVLVPFLFFVIGAVGLVSSIRRARQKAREELEGAVRPIEPSTGPVTLRSTWNPAKKLAVMILIALLWNGAIALPIRFFLFEPMGPFNWIVGLFMTPFVLVELFLIVLVFYTFLTLFNPRPMLRLSSQTVPPGGAFDLEWEFEGASHRLRSLKILLEVREEATYRRGTSTSTDKNVFCSLVIHNASEQSNIGGAVAGGAAIERGRTRAEVPRGTMHSWAAENNKVIWSLRVKGGIAFWPDVDEDFSFTVLPESAELSR